MARHHNAEGKQRNNISKRLSRVEAQVKELTKTGPPRPEDTVGTPPVLPGLDGFFGQGGVQGSPLGMGLLVIPEPAAQFLVRITFAAGGDGRHDEDPVD